MNRFGADGFRNLAEAAALVLAALALFYVVGVLNPLVPAGITTDRLGPDNGEPVAEYVDRASDSVDEFAGDAESHWSLVSFEEYVSSQSAYETADGRRIAQVLARVPIDRVQTPVISVGVPGSEKSVLDSLDTAATKVSGSMGQWDRQSQIDAASATRFAAGCDCVVGLIVHASGDSLAALATEPGVRAVEALPSDAVAGKFAVRALLPEHVDVVGPLPDDGDIPPP